MCMGAPSIPKPIEMPDVPEASLRLPQTPVMVDDSIDKRRNKTKKQRRQQAITARRQPDTGTVQTPSNNNSNLSGGY